MPKNEDKKARTRDDANERLASELHCILERLRPEDGGEWEELSEKRREYYRLAIDHVLGFSELLDLAVHGAD